MSTDRRAGIIGGIVGLAAAGTAVGVAAERYAIGRIRHAEDGRVVAERFGALPADRSRTVIASDGVPLYLEEVGPRDAPVTVVFVHGYGLDSGCWHFQRTRLPGLLDYPVRMVFPDQRSHGRSARGPAEHATIGQLGRDLSAVLADVAAESSARRPEPIVLVGHSMGGMAVLAFAGVQPDLFAPADNRPGGMPTASRVAAVGLLSTSAGDLGDIDLGLPPGLAVALRPARSVALATMRRRPGFAAAVRRLTSDVGWLLTRHYSFGSTDVSPALVSYIDSMLAATPADVIAEFLPTFAGHDEIAALPVLTELPVAVIAGSADRLTPVSHSRQIADALPHAALTVIDGAAHLAMMERPDVVNAELVRLIEQIAPPR